MATNPNQNEYYQNSKSDIKLSAWEYNDLVDAVMDDRLSASGLIKFKNLYTANSMSNLVICTFMVPPAYLLARWLQGSTNRGMASSRFTFLGMLLFYPITLYYGFNKPIPRKLYTQIMADYGDDGEYVRQMLAVKKPGLWKKVSEQMEDLGFDFPEMLSSRATTQFPIPTGFAATRVL